MLVINKWEYHRRGPFTSIEMQDEMDVETPAEPNEPDNFLEEEETISNPDVATEECSQDAAKPFDDDDGSTCPICLEAWTNSGGHRICALKCGHLFGHKCILRWLESQSKKSCPTCKKLVRRSDLRFIYAKKLIAVDNTELEMVKQQLEIALMQKNDALLNISKYVSREHVLQAEIEQLNKKIQELTLGRKPIDFRLTLQSPLSRLRLYMEKNVEVCNKSGCRDCRVFDVSVPHDLLLIATRSPTDLFGGFGLKKLSFSNYKPIKFIPLHKDPIRDMCFHPVENKVLTVSMDKKFRITDAHSTHTLYTVSLDSAPWACGWSPRNSEELFVGTQNGIVSIFDVRNLQEPKVVLSIPGDFSPVVSLAGVKEPSRSDVLLVAKLNSVWAFECHPDGTYNRHLLPLQGPFLSLNYDSETKQVLVTSRPNSHTVYARHTVCHLEKSNDPDTITCNPVYIFKGGNTAKLLAKTSCFVPNNIVAAHHETRKSILLYSVNTGEEIGSCPTHDHPVLDIKGLDTTNGKFLVYLNEKKLEFFKFNVF